MNGTEGPDFYVPVSNATGVVRSPHEHPQYYLAEPWVFSSLAMYVFFLIVVGVPVNILTLFVTVSHKPLRTRFYYMLVNMAMADLLVIGVSLPFTMHTAISGYFVHGIVGCNFEGFFTVHGTAISLWSLVVLATERCVMSFQPGVDLRTRRKLIVKGVGFTWSMAFTCSLPPLLEWSRYIPEGLQCSCGVDYYTIKPDLYSESFIYYMFTVHVGVPFMLITVCCARLLCRSDPNESEQEANRMTVTMALVFFICWTPYLSLGWDIFTHHGSAFDPFLMTMTSYFAKSSVLYNPLICICMDKQFRQGMMAMLFQGKNPST
ncbi:rhodopsin, like [Trichomycterus rosablanca]|uniref:rhodopsin, like n=1 Tax=Trichomycterus rosablanca TaxID=2290929 RepID=UPI002F355E09